MRALYLQGHLTESELVKRHPGFRVHFLFYEYLNEKEFTKALLVEPGEQVPAGLIREPIEDHFTIPANA